MKRVLATSIALACLSTGVQADSIKTFRQLCLANAGNPSAIMAAGKKAGFDMTKIGESSAMGLRKKTDESLQINVFTNHAFECAVTTSDMANPDQVGAAFFKSLGLKPKRGQAKGSVGGQSYTFKHDSEGGEAFVMYRN